MWFAWNDKSTWVSLRSLLLDKRRTANELFNILTSKYEGVLVFHGCRIKDVSNYYENGLQISSSAALDAQARSLFLTGEFPEITPEALAYVIAEIGNRDDGRIYACLDKRHILGDAGHYLIYGSERLCAIAAGVTTDNSFDYKQILKRIGQPTLLHVGLCWEHVSDSDFKQFISLVERNLPAILSERLLPVEMFTFEWCSTLLGSAILAHEHPACIIDPLSGMRPYYFEI